MLSDLVKKEKEGREGKREKEKKREKTEVNDSKKQKLETKEKALMTFEHLLLVIAEPSCLLIFLLSLDCFYLPQNNQIPANTFPFFFK